MDKAWSRREGLVLMRQTGRSGGRRALAPAASAVVPALLLIGGLAGCASTPSAEPSPSDSPRSITLSVEQACANVDSIMDPITDDPDSTRATQLQGELNAIAQQAPKDVKRRIEDLGTALVQAATMPDGFAEGSRTGENFVLAAQELRVLCEPEGSDPERGNPTPSESGDAAASTDLGPDGLSVIAGR